jgi:hypothetical protein
LTGVWRNSAKPGKEPPDRSGESIPELTWQEGGCQERFYYWNLRFLLLYWPPNTRETKVSRRK